MKLLMRLHVRDLALFQYGLRRFNLMRRPDKADDDTVAKDASKQSSQSTKQQGRVIERTVQDLKARYSNLLIVSLPLATPAHYGLIPETETQKQLFTACKQSGVPYLDVRPVLEADYKRSHVPSFGFYNTLPWLGHLNARGHDLVASALREYLKNDLCKSRATT
jgi:hypothetical protein